MWVLGTIGATAPFVGLAGTVIGIMGAFGKISETQSNEFSLVAGPIAEALVATLAGIIVAVIAVILYNFFNRRLATISVETRLLTDEFLELLSDAGDGEGGSATKEDADGSREAA
jgi:biopolymer transport protein ExbB